MQDLDLLRLFAAHLHQAGAGYMIAGSVASMHDGELSRFKWWNLVPKP